MGKFRTWIFSVVLIFGLTNSIALGYTLSDLESGEMSAAELLAFHSSQMDSCTKEALNHKPEKKTSYLTAKATFDKYVCIILLCFEREVARDYLAESSITGDKNLKSVYESMMSKIDFSSCDK